MRTLFKRALGQILVDGRFLSPRALERALEDQKQTKELLGQVLTRMGVLKEADVKAPLAIQPHLNTLEEAAKLAAGKRQLLGALLVQSGQLTNEQLDGAIAEQKKTGEKLGEVFIRLGLLTDLQLKGLLELQHNQESPLVNLLRLGELLVATGYITREQLEKSLARQSQTGKRLGEVLVSEGFARKSQVNHGMSLQKMLASAVVAAIMSLGMASAASAATVALEWDASPDASVTGYKVHYQADSSTQPFQGFAPVNVQGATATEIADLDPSRSYSFAVTAYNAEGMESVYSNIVVIPESVPPTAGIASLAAGATVSGVVSVSANAADNVAVTKVEFYVNGVLQASASTAPYVFWWDTSTLPTGSYDLSIAAYDAAGNVGQSQALAVHVSGDALVPIVTLTSPDDGTSVSGSVSISAEAQDNSGVTNTEFYLDSALLYASNVAPFSYTWDTRSAANGSHIVTARAYDAAGNVGLSQAVTVNVANDTIAPTVAITSPSANSTVSGTITIAVSAADDVEVTRVDVYRDGSLLFTTNAAPYSFSWNTKSIANGAYTLTAKAFDAAGHVTQSTSIPVNVSNSVTRTTPAKKK